jgi:hypothetical protein
MKRFPYTYWPTIDDRLQPNVVQGEAIAINARVRIARELHPPMLPTKYLVFIQDTNNNVQSVWRRSLFKG